MSDALLVAADLHKTFRMGRVSLEVLRGASLTVQPGEFVAIMGRSGSGKSTLLHVLGALDAAERGEVFCAGDPIIRPRSRWIRTAAAVDRVMRWLELAGSIAGRFILPPVLIVFLNAALVYAVAIGLATDAGGLLPVFVWTLWVALAGLGIGVAAFAILVLVLLIRLGLADLVEWRRTAMRRRKVGFVFQFYHLLPELNALENVLLPRMIGGWLPAWPLRRAQARADAAAILNRVGLGERLRHRPNQLSGGERQRVAIARALVHRPRILLADEPTGNLDAESGASIMALLKELHRAGQTIVMVTHDPSCAAYADRVLLLQEGKLIPRPA